MRLFTLLGILGTLFGLSAAVWLGASHLSWLGFSLAATAGQLVYHFLKAAAKAGRLAREDGNAQDR